MASMQWGQNDDGEEEIPEMEEHWYGGRDGIIFLIDVTKPMFKIDGSGESPFHKCIKCCRTTFLNKIVGSERDMIGVVLFGTEKTSNALNAEHISTLQELAEPSAEAILKLDQVLKCDNDQFFKKEYGHNKDFALSNALWLCQNMFGTSQYKLGSQRILLFTNSSEPHPDSPDKQRQARVRAQDFWQINIDLDLLHLGDKFDASLFYSELVQLAKGDTAADWVLPDPATQFDELLLRVSRRDYKKRSFGKLLFTLGEGVACGVSIYNLVRRAVLPKKILLDRESNIHVKSSRQTYHADTGEGLLASDVNKYQKFGGKEIVFRPDEVESIKRMTEPGLVLLGFKPASAIKLHHHLSPSSFIYPEEDLVKGSRGLMAALLDRCVARNVVPVCHMTRGEGNFPKFVMLLPQQEKLDETGMQVLPPGFHVIYQLSAENFRDMDLSKPEKATPEQVALAKRVVGKMTFKYSPYSFENPKLQTHWRSIEALALDYDTAEQGQDFSMPDDKAISKSLGPLAREFIEGVYSDGYDGSSFKKKRAAKPRSETVRAPPAAKRTGAVGESEMEEYAKDYKVEKLLVDDLKTFLVSKGIKVTKKKKLDLVNDIYNYFNLALP